MTLFSIHSPLTVVNANVSYLYNHFNPAVLRLIKLTIDSARKNNIWVGMCGEMASDPTLQQF